MRFSTLTVLAVAAIFTSFTSGCGVVPGAGPNHVTLDAVEGQWAVTGACGAPDGFTIVDQEITWMDRAAIPARIRRDTLVIDSADDAVVVVFNNDGAAGVFLGQGVVEPAVKCVRDAQSGSADAWVLPRALDA